MKNKRGMSAVVTTLLIILLSIVAVGVVWVVVRNVLSKGQEDISLTGISIELEIKKASIEGDTLSVTVYRASGKGELLGINFVIGDGSNSVVIRRDTTMGELETKTFTFSKSTELSSLTSIKNIMIVPIYKTSGGKEKTGDIADSTNIGGSSGEGDDRGETGTGICGDGLIQNPNSAGVHEKCDGTNITETCHEVNPEFTGGTLACSTDCTTYVVIGCTGVAPGSCDGSWSPPEDAGVDCDGGAKCGADCKCPKGFATDSSGGCSLNPPVDTGTINSIWNKIYLDSHNLPKDSTVANYAGKFMNFTGSSETGCFEINFADYLPSPNDISYVRLDGSKGYPNVNAGQGYNIWEAENCGQ